MHVLRGVSDECSDPVNTISSGRPLQSYKSSITLSPHFFVTSLSELFPLSWQEHSTLGREKSAFSAHILSLSAQHLLLSDHTVANSSFIYLSKYQLWWSGRKNVCFAVSLLVLLHYSSRASLDIRTGVCVDLKACLCPCWWTSAKSGREKWLIWRAICLSNVFLPVWKTNNNGKITFLGRMRFDATNMCPSFFNFSKQSHFQFFSLCGTSRNWSLLNVPSFLDCFSFGRLRIHWGSVLSCFLPLISEAVNHKCQR